MLAGVALCAQQTEVCEWGRAQCGEGRGDATCYAGIAEDRDGNLEETLS